MLRYCLLFVILCPFNQLSADHQGGEYLFYPNQCYEILNEFAKHASNFTYCSILNARPTITLCEKCVNNYVNFRDKYEELITTVVNGTSCRSIFISHDRLNAVQEYHDNILAVWNNANCNGCFDWLNGIPSLKNETINFHKMYNDTMNCINTHKDSTNNEVCNTCMQNYELLDEFYKSLSSDSIGVDSICMDIVDSMNDTRSTWSKNLNCCNLRRTPEIIFLCSAAIISFLPILFYSAVRFCGPIRDLPNVLKQSRFKQTILRGLSRSDSRND